MYVPQVEQYNAYELDTQRIGTHHPGELVYSAQFNHEKLKRLYCCMTCPFCCNTDEMARNTSFDVYTNYVQMTMPYFWMHHADCCCGRPAIGFTRYYDNPNFMRDVQSHHACACCCGENDGCFGDKITQVNIMGALCQPLVLGQCRIVYHCCCEISCLFGLKENEGKKLAQIINSQVQQFKSNPRNYAMPPRVAQAAYAAAPMA